MLKKLSVFLLIWFFLVSVSYAIEGSNLDVRLKVLLGNETVPFFPDSVRQEFITLAMNQCGRMSDAVTSVKVSGYVLTGAAALGYNATGLQAVLGVHAIWNTDGGYALRRINAKDVGRKKIATEVPAQYWYMHTQTSAKKEFGIYPAVTDSTNFAIFVYGMPGWADSANLCPAYENEVVLLALSLCKKRQGQTQIAEFIRKIAETELLDLKFIWRNRPIDIRRQKEVVP